MSEILYPLESLFPRFRIIGCDKHHSVIFNVDFHSRFINNLIDDFSSRANDSRGFFPD